MPIRTVGTPAFGGQELANAGALTRQSQALDAQFANFINQLPLEVAGTFINLLEASRARRAQKSAASEARKQQRLSLGIGAGVGAATGGISGAILGPTAGLTPGVGALLGGSLGLGAGTIGANAAGIAPSTFQAFQAPPTLRGGSLGSFGAFTPQAASPVSPVAEPRAVSPSGGVNLGGLSTPIFGPGQVQAPTKSATERAIIGEEPSAGLTITPKDIESSAKRIGQMGQKAIDDGDPELALRIAQVLAQLRVA